VTEAPTAAGLVARLRAEFRAEWSDRKKQLDLAIQQSSSALAIQGNGRSSALIRKHCELLEEALADAQKILIRRAAALVSEVRQPHDALPRLSDAIGDEVTQLASTFTNLLDKEVKNIGLGAGLTESLQIKRKALATRLESDLGGAVAAARRVAVPPEPPWYQRPVGLVVLMSLAALLGGLAVWFISVKVLK